MGYNIGQIRRTSIPLDQYKTEFKEGTDYFMSTVETEGALDDNIQINFTDQCINMESLATGISSTFSYYLRFSVEQRVDAPQDFILEARNSEGSETTQELRSFTCAVGTNGNSTVFELIFHPIQTFNQLVFKLTRTGLDFTIYDAGTYITGREMKVEVLEFSRLENIVDKLRESFDDLGTLSKLGIQGPPGMLFTLDGEEFRIGRSGIFELYDEDINISYVGFVVKTSLVTQGDTEEERTDFFIMDFKY